MKLTQPLEFSIAQFLLLNFQSSLLCRMFMALLLKLGRPFDPNWAWQNLNNTIIIYGPQRPQGCICGPLRSRGYTPLGCIYTPITVLYTPMHPIHPYTVLYIPIQVWFHNFGLNIRLIKGWYSEESRIKVSSVWVTYKYRRSRVPTRDLSSRPVPKLCNLSRVKAEE